MRATRIAQQNHASALAFAPDGTLYVTVIGIQDDSADPKAGGPGTAVIFKGV
jgi:hypothetical protein